MFDFGPEKLFIVVAAVFIFLGPKELPAAARTVGSVLRQLQSWRDMLHGELGAALQLPTEPTPPSHPVPVHYPEPQVEGSDEEPGFPAGPSSFR
jgi:Sec-independent protein translocase protein TatA